MYRYQELLIPAEFREAAALLAGAGLEFPDGVTFSLGAYADGADGRLAGTGFLAGNVVCGICVSPEHQGSGLAAAIVSRLVQHALEAGIRRLMLFTKPVEAGKFGEIGFHALVATGSAALLEWGHPDYIAWLRETRAALVVSAPGDATDTADSSFDFPLGAIVINANPFTLGHRHLALEALARCRRIVVFVVEEDASTFPFSLRYALVREGLADQDRAIFRSGGPYMVSRASFPSYFTGKVEHSRVHAELDCTLFASRIAPDLGITARFVGEEPYCGVTAAYNAIMRVILPHYGVTCVEVPRLAENGAAISASAVRAALREEGKGKTALGHLIPASTAAFLESPEAEPILAALRKQDGRH